MFGLKSKILDVWNALLYGNIEEEIFMERSPGMIDAEEMNASMILYRQQDSIISC